MRYQREQSSGEYDFDLVYSDGRVAAVEVTASVDEALERTTARIRDKRRGGPFVPTMKCQNDWLVHPLPDADIRIIRRDVDEYCQP